MASTIELPDDLSERATAEARIVGLSLEQFVTATVASRLETRDSTRLYLAERSARADKARALAILARAGLGNPPAPGDELE